MSLAEAPTQGVHDLPRGNEEHNNKSINSASRGYKQQQASMRVRVRKRASSVV